MKKIFLLFSIFFFLFSFSLAVKAAGASLYLSPSTGNYTAGNTFSIEIKVNSGGVAINAADGTLVFNPDKLEVKSISKTDSVFTLWVQEPAFSNSLGTITFAGGKPSPGYTGSAGTVIAVTFRAKTSGAANLTFAAGSVLADDGKGTNVLTNLGSGSYQLIAREITPLPLTEEGEQPQTVAGQPPAAPIVSSKTHPDEKKWCSNNDPEFFWKLPSGATGVSLLLNQKPTSNPGPTSDGLMESKKFEDAEDGTWYFHIKFKNNYGWGAILHHKVLIDTQPPEPFKIIVDKQGDLYNPSPVLYFSTQDTLSGVEYYEVIIDNNNSSKIASADIKTNPFQIPPQEPGKHSILVKAFDGAENFVQADTEVEITPIESPKITKIPRTIKVGAALTIEGEALPDITVRIYIQKKGEEPILEKAKAGADGKFVFSYEKTLNEGDYLVWAQSENEKGALSLATKQYSLKVGLSPILEFGTIAISYLTVMGTLIILIAVLILVIFYIWYQISMWRKRVSKETKEISQSVAGAFRALRDEVEEQIAVLDKKPGLTKGEKEIRDKLQEALDVSEKFIREEIKDVEKELE